MRPFAKLIGHLLKIAYLFLSLFIYLFIYLQYLTAHLRRVVREVVASSGGSDCAVTATTTPPAGHDTKQLIYAKYCLRHVAAPRARTRRLPPSAVEIEVKR